METKTDQIFLRNLDSGEPAYHCGETTTLGRHEVGGIIESEIRTFLEERPSDSLNLRVEVVGMTQR